MWHYVAECEKVKDWFVGLRENVEQRNDRLWSDEVDEEKEKVLRKLW